MQPQSAKAPNLSTTGMRDLVVAIIQEFVASFFTFKMQTCTYSIGRVAHFHTKPRLSGKTQKKTFDLCTHLHALLPPVRHPDQSLPYWSASCAVLVQEVQEEEEPKEETKDLIGKDRKLLNPTPLDTGDNTSIDNKGFRMLNTNK